MRITIEETEFMAGGVTCITVDLSGSHDLVVVYLGMRVNFLSGIKTLLGLRPLIYRVQ